MSLKDKTLSILIIELNSLTINKYNIKRIREIRDEIKRRVRK